MIRRSLRNSTLAVGGGDTEPKGVGLGTDEGMAVSVAVGGAVRVDAWVVLGVRFGGLGSVEVISVECAVPLLQPDISRTRVKTI